MKYPFKLYVLKWLIKRFRAKELIDYYFDLGEYQCQLRMEPKAFRDDLRALSNLIDDEKYAEAAEATEKAYSKWGCDPEFLRLGSFNHHLNAEVEENTDDRQPAPQTNQSASGSSQPNE